ncbi:hypothetical protein M409DRAFT_22817 [Zasmidium cellare ATCC 36951]|uniref:SET domain-containing protein n=1 Tax=Zasmidium cellare ATCC 36951 TaxID=1080233 RepID=A0A6A6CJI2_ZASCE|nr:uncharacterized protein M409DRAFT_22817 [Zasmidium cellare ATCC 36951]KAF2166763.1 hypothetical protein M409DRAFT_22817 [Zasmidium cellare ATCC 36951]
MATSPEDSHPFAILPIPNKGYGCIANRPISPGEVIYQEATIMHIAIPAQRLTETHITTAFAALPDAQKKSVLSLHEGTHRTDLHSKVMRIFKANTFGNGSACWLHPTISRFNHSCVPNATTHNDPCCLGDEAQIVAEREIAEGEEICFSYNNEMYEITTARQRRALLQKQYGFECDCRACGGGEEGRARDARRVLIKALRARLHGLRTSDFGILDDGGGEENELAELDLWVKEVQVKEALPAGKRAAYNVLLGNLREAEGMPATDVAVDYWHAAEAMLDQLMQMQDVVVLQWAKNVQLYMEKAIDVMERVRSPYDHESQTLRSAWKAMQSRPCLKVALAYLDGALEAKGHELMSVDDEEPFAIQITKSGELQVLYKNECDKLFEARDDISVASQEDEPSPDGILRSIRTKMSTEKLRSHIASHGVYKLIGAALTCAAPVAAYWMMR